MSESEITGWSDVEVTSWSRLLEELHDPSVIPVQKGQGGHFRSPYVFRGMSDASWPLQTSLERLGTPPHVVEDALIRSFRKYAPRGTFAEDSEWEALAVAQHNGLPTRVLDWSVSPLVAAHFATAERKHFGVDGIIWCIDVIRLRDKILPPLLSAPLQTAPAAVYDVRMLSRIVPTLHDFDSIKSTACVFFEPPSIDTRISNQVGILSAINDSVGNHQQYFGHVGAAEPNLVRRIIIRKQAKGEIRDMLDQNNVNERMLFPGLPGLCDWLRRYYGPA
jgi:hypothetical protein